MADYLLNEQQWAISTVPETSLNTNYTIAGEFTGILPANNPPHILPAMEKKDNRASAGNDGLPTAICNVYWQPGAVTFEGEVDFAGPFARLALRSVGGTVTPTLLGSSVYKHVASWYPKASGLQLPSTTILGVLGGSDFLLAGCVVNEFSLSQQGAAAPRISCTLINTGKYVNPSTITPPTPSDPPCVTGVDTQIIFTDDVDTAANMYTVEDVRSWSVNYSANLKTGPNQRRGGDTKIGPTNGTAAYLSRLRRGVRTLSGQIVMGQDADLTRWTQAAKNTTFTDLIFRCRGALAGGAYYYQLDYQIPKATIRVAAPGDDEGEATQVLQWEAMKDVTTGGGSIVTVQNLSTSNFK